jgi:RNA polymerase sigma factor (sigma-70 family)
LLRQFVETQSDEAFAALVTRHINLVYSVALRQVGQPHNAEEIAQAVFIILAKKAAGLRHEQALTSWLFQTARLAANNYVRSELRRRHREQEAYMESVLDESARDVWPKIAPLLDGAVASLREKDRRAILLRFYEGRNLSEVGALLGASESAAEKRVSRALEKLRTFFSRRGVDSTASVIAENISVHSVQIAPVALAKTVTAVALAKGATASASTLTLIKGALKIMAWTKAKTTITVGVVALLAIGTTTLTIITIQWLAHSREGYTIDSHAEQNAQGYRYVWTVHNQDQSWGLDQFAIEVPIKTHVLTNSIPPPYSNPDGSAYWTVQESRQAQVDDHDGRVWLPAAGPGKKWILWWGQQSSSVYPSNSIVTFSLTTDAATKPGKIVNYTITYTPQNDPHYYRSFRAKVTGPAN